MDIFVDWRGGDGAALAKQIKEATQGASSEIELVLITNRGVKVWPNGFPGACAANLHCILLRQLVCTVYYYVSSSS